MHEKYNRNSNFLLILTQKIKFISEIKSIKCVPIKSIPTLLCDEVVETLAYKLNSTSNTVSNNVIFNSY